MIIKRQLHCVTACEWTKIIFYNSDQINKLFETADIVPRSAEHGAIFLATD